MAALKKGFEPSFVMKIFKDTKGFNKLWVDKVKILSLGDGKCSAELKVEEEHTNPMGGLHGGFSATLADVLSQVALLTAAPTKNVSVDINLSYIKGAKVGDEILVDVNILKTGKSLAFAEIEIKNKATRDLLVKASHTLYLLK